MIRNDDELATTLERVRWIQNQLATLRKVETNLVNYRLSASGFLAELDRMQLQVREYLSMPEQSVLAG
jgi:hypothetical protein